MKKGFLKKTALFLALIMTLSLCAFASEVDYGAKLDEALDIYRSFGLFSNNETDYVREALIEMFEEDPDLFYELVNKIYSRDDRYSKYLTPQAYEETYELGNTMVGIGVVITTTEDGYLVLQSVTKGPARDAGLKAGDKLIEVDGSNVEGFLPAEVAAFVKGPEGSSVSLKVLRDGEMLTFNVRRAKIATSEASISYIDDKIGYMKFSHFNGISAYIDFMDAYDEFENKGVNTVILDLRNNPGGQIDCLINIIDNVIPKKDVPYLMAWQAKPLKMKTYYTEGYGWEFNKFVILVNKNTASAAEIMAGVMQDLGYAVVVGEQTFGKGLGQIHAKTKDGDEAIVTVMQLKLPTSGSYDEIGITPDYVVANKLTPYKTPRLTPLKSKTVTNKIKTENVRAIEERLRELGYFYATPDDEWDKRTVHAINVFCRENNLPMIGSVCSWELTEKIDAAVKNLNYKYTVEDTQLEKAIEIARQYAASDEKAQCVDESTIDFRRG